MVSQGQKTFFCEGISFFGKIPNTLRLFLKILRFHNLARKTNNVAESPFLAVLRTGRILCF